MNRDPLEQLLRDADAGDATPAVDGDLARRVRDRAKRQRRNRATGGGFAATACALVLVAWMMWPHEQPAPLQIVRHATQSPKAPEDARAELLALSAEADRLAAVAEALWATEQPTRAAARRRSAGGRGGDVAAQVERAAFTMVYQAARMPAARGAASPAAEVYRQVAQSFPDTASGEVARQRLTQLQSRKDG